MPIFTQSLQRIDTANPQDAIKKLYNHMKYLQEELEYILLNLDSHNINEIDTDKTIITDSTGSTSIGSYINMTGTKGESFTVGKNTQGQFEFSINGKDGKQVIYLNSSGELVITEHTNLTVDGGKW